jgi:hypothetical protein
MGVGPYRSQLGDVVVILYGADRPLLLRPKGEQYELIGDAYVHGVSRGELFVGISEELMPGTRDITIY